MVIKQVRKPTYYANIYLGLRKRYTDFVFHEQNVIDIVQDFVNDVHYCTTITPTHFYYVDGEEPGVIIGIINYPRFPKTKVEIRKLAIELTKLLMDKLDQNRISIVCPDTTIMLERDDTTIKS